MNPPGPAPDRGEGNDPLLLEILRERISARGPLSFAEFMQTVLYHPGRGYYARPVDPVGRHEGSDYYTSPSRHPVFGRLLGRQVAECLGNVGEGPMEIVEVGPGNGALFSPLLRELRIAWPAGLRATLVEANPSRAASQQRLLVEAGIGEGVRWISPADWEPSAERIRGCVVANEILDAMPVHRVVFQGGEFREIFVDWQDGLVEISGPISRHEVLAELERQGFEPREGQEAEVSLESLRWIRRLGAKLERGYVILVDYGYAAPEIHAPRHQRGTLLAYHQHRASEDYLRRVGFQDLTAHVNFTSILGAAAGAGLISRGPVSQGRFLLALGALDWLAKPGDRFDWEEFRDRKAIQDLFVPGGMGESHKVLVLATPGLEMDLTGLRPPERWTPPAPDETESAGLSRGE